MILEICDEPGILRVIEIILKAILIIRIAVPILLIISLMLSFASAVKDNDNDALNKAKKGAVTKIISAVLVFLIPTFVSVISDITGNGDYRDCIDLNIGLKTGVNVEKAYENRINELISRFEESEEENDYLAAKNYISQIDYIDLRDKSLERLEELYAEIMIADGICTGEYEGGYGLASIKADVTKGKGVYYKFINAGRVMQEGTSTEYKTTNNYELLIHPTVEIKTKSGKVKQVECTVKHKEFPKYNKDGYYFQKTSNNDKTSSINNPYTINQLSYYMYVPKNLKADTKVPLVLALHGGFGWGVPCKGSTTSEANQTYHFLKTALYKNKYPINKVDSPDVNAIVLAPSNMTCNWEPSVPKAMDILYAYVKLFNVDVDSVVVTGTSQGGYGTMYTGFLEEQIIYSPTNNDTTLESVAKMYNTTVANIKDYNKKLKLNISYSDSAQTKLKKGTQTIIKAKKDDNMRSLFSMLVPMSPAKNDSRCAFTPSTIYDEDKSCSANPPYTLRTPIWVITSNDEYPKIQMFAKELTAYYEKHGDIRYTVLTNLPKVFHADSHDTQVAILGYTNAFDWIISQKYGQVTIRNNAGITSIEKQLGSAFAKDFHP